MSHRLSLHMLIGLAAGTLAGVTAHALFPDSGVLAGFVSYVTEPIGQLFLRLLFMLVLPLLVSALALGVAGLGDLRALGRIGLRTLACTVAFSGLAVAIGIMLVRVIQPGVGLPDEARARLLELKAAAPAAAPAATAANATGMDFLVKLVPNNPIKAMADGDMLAVMVFALFLGIGLAAVRSTPARRFEEALQGLYEISMRLLGMVIGIAPIAVACLLFTLTARLGYGVLGLLGSYVFVVILGLAIQQFGVYSLAVRFFAGMSPLEFFRGIRPAMLTAFSTASSNATLPTALLVAERDLKLPPTISRFVLTVGSTANQNGTGLFEGVTVLFLAQFFGVELSLSQQITVVVICILGGIGTAGVPAGSIPVIAMVLGMVSVPVEGIGIILGVDRLLDMCRTCVNVSGDLAVAAVVSRGGADPAAELAAARAASATAATE